MTFTISRKLDTLFTIRAASYSEAAIKAARKLYGRAAVAHRTTGDNGKSGYFQAYKPLAKRLGGGLNSEGEPFHVQ